MTTLNEKTKREVKKMFRLLARKLQCLILITILGFIVSEEAQSQYFVKSLSMSGTNPDVLYAGTDDGIFKTTDGGISWIMTGSIAAAIKVLQVGPDNPEIVYGGTEDGIYKSEDGGVSWIQKGLSGAIINAIAIDYADPDILYAGTGKFGSQGETEITGVFKSTDGGEHWEMKYSEDLDKVATLLIDSDDPSIVLAGFDPWPAVPDGGLLKSTDRGETWEWMDIDPGRTGPDVDCLVMSPAGFSPSVIYASGGGNVYKSPDIGESWSRTDYNIPFSFPYRADPVVLAVDPNDPGVVYAGTVLWRLLTEPTFHSELYRTTDGGDTWVQKDIGLPEVFITGIVIDPRDSDVYVSLSPGGVFKSTDGGDTWQTLVAVEDGPGNLSIPIAYYLSQNYPNPFNPSTKIRFGLPREAHVVLKVYNVVGEQVQILLDERKQAGVYDVRFHARGLPSGIYFYRLQAGEFVETKKLLLIR